MARVNNEEWLQTLQSVEKLLDLLKAILTKYPEVAREFSSEWEKAKR